MSFPPAILAAFIALGHAAVPAAHAQSAAQGAAQKAEKRAPAPVTLTDAIERALREHPALRRAEYWVQENRHRVGVAQSGYFPKLFFGAQWFGASLNGSPAETLGMPDFPRITGTGPLQVTSGPARNSNSLNPHSNWISGISSGIPIADFGRTHGRVRSAQGLVQESEAAEATARQRLVAGVARAYYGALAARALVQTAQQSVERLTVYAAQAEEMVRAQLRNPIDVPRAQAALASARGRLLTLRNDERVALAVLENAIGARALGRYDLVEDTSDWRVLGSLQAHLAAALRIRPELAELRGRLVAASGRLETARGGYYPSLGGTASVNGRGTGGFGNYFNYDAGLLFVWPLFEGYRSREEALQATARWRALDATEQGLLQRIELEVRTAHARLQAAAESITASRATARHAGENLRLARGTFRAGLASILVLADAEELFTTASVSSVRARYAYKLAAADLERAVGGRIPTAQGPLP